MLLVIRLNLLRYHVHEALRDRPEGAPAFIFDAKAQENLVHDPVCPQGAVGIRVARCLTRLFSAAYILRARSEHIGRAGRSPRPSVMSSH